MCVGVFVCVCIYIEQKTVCRLPFFIMSRKSPLFGLLIGGHTYVQSGAWPILILPFPSLSSSLTVVTPPPQPPAFTPRPPSLATRYKDLKGLFVHDIVEGPRAWILHCTAFPDGSVYPCNEKTRIVIKVPQTGSDLVNEIVGNALVKEVDPSSHHLLQQTLCDLSPRRPGMPPSQSQTLGGIGVVGFASREYDADLSGCIGKLPDESIILILEHMIEALSTLHSKGFAHGDVKPENIFIIYYTAVDGGAGSSGSSSSSSSGRSSSSTSTSSSIRAITDAVLGDLGSITRVGVAKAYFSLSYILREHACSPNTAAQDWISLLISAMEILGVKRFEPLPTGDRVKSELSKLMCSHTASPITALLTTIAIKAGLL